MPPISTVGYAVVLILWAKESSVGSFIWSTHWPSASNFQP